MGVLALLEVVREGGRMTDQNGSYSAIEDAPLGRVLLGLGLRRVDGVDLILPSRMVARRGSRGRDSRCGPVPDLRGLLRRVQEVSQARGVGPWRARLD